jgi:hypothetical protein
VDRVEQEVEGEVAVAAAVDDVAAAAGRHHANKLLPKISRLRTGTDL